MGLTHFHGTETFITYIPRELYALRYVLAIGYINTCLQCADLSVRGRANAGPTFTEWRDLREEAGYKTNAKETVV